MLSGEYSVTLDDTGRIALPRKLRDFLSAGKIMLTKGADSCLWMFTLEQWELFEKTIYSTTDQFSARGRRNRQQFIGPKQELDIDRQGRILIPPTLRDHAGLCKECIVLGQVDYIEIWDDERYKAYLRTSEEDFKAGLEEIGAVIKRERESGGVGNNAYSGAAGGDHTVSRSEGQG
jgi:MraZ protein